MGHDRRRQHLLQQLVCLTSLVHQHPRGTNVATLIKDFSEKHGVRVQPRTMLRWLRILRRRGGIRSDGEARATRYYPVSKAGASASPGSGIREESDQVVLTQDGLKVLFIIRQPSVQGRRVGYRESLLREYRPGETWYLPAQVRERLHKIGATSDRNQEAGTYVRTVFERFLVDLAWASSQLDGNRYSRLDVVALFRYGQAAEGTTEQETRMIRNHQNALGLVIQQPSAMRVGRLACCALHGAVAEGLVGESDNEGRVRTGPVGVSGSVYRPLGVADEIETGFDRLIRSAEGIPDPFEQAFFLLVHLSYLHPFLDANERTARMFANIPLVRANVCPLSFTDVPVRIYAEAMLGVYELGRMELLRDVFVWAYERSCTQYGMRREETVIPDPVDGRYQHQLQQIVQAHVQQGILPTTTMILEWAKAHQIPAQDLSQFAQSAREIILSLHIGVLGRYRVLPHEFTQWQALVMRQHWNYRTDEAPGGTETLSGRPVEVS